jgi:ribosomal protein S18 acetylase RimI-like enzyme
MYIEITENPNEHDAKTISQGIIDFNDSKVPDLEPIDKEVKFFVFARNQTEDIVGGIRAVCFWNTLHIELLWLSESCRGQGIGKKLIDAAENFAKENDCEKVFVETTSWQAKPFYEKVGYTHIATLNDRPKGHASHYLTKDLSS